MEPALSAPKTMPVLPRPGLCSAAVPAFCAAWISTSPRMYDSVKRFEPTRKVSALTANENSNARATTTRTRCSVARGLQHLRQAGFAEATHALVANDDQRYAPAAKALVLGVRRGRFFDVQLGIANPAAGEEFPRLPAVSAPVGRVHHDVQRARRSSRTRRWWLAGYGRRPANRADPGFHDFRLHSGRRLVRAVMHTPIRIRPAVDLLRLRRGGGDQGRHQYRNQRAHSFSHFMPRVPAGGPRCRGTAASRGSRTDLPAASIPDAYPRRRSRRGRARRCGSR